MNSKSIKIYRFLLNFTMFSLLLVLAAHYAYTNNSELFGLKNALIPYGNAMIFVVIISFVLAVINEVMTLLLVKIAERRNR